MVGESMRGPVRRFLRRIIQFLAYCYTAVLAPLITALVETDRAHWKRHKSAWSDGDLSDSSLPDDSILSTLNAIVEREVSESKYLSPEEGSRKALNRRTSPLRTAEIAPSQSSSSSGRRRILPFWGARKPASCNHGASADCGHSPRHTAQLFLAKNYNLSHNAVSYDRGVLEETVLNLEVFITKLFESLRVCLRSVLLVPRRNATQPEATRPHIRRASFQDMSDLGGTERMQSARERKAGLHRTRSAGVMDALPRKQAAQRDGDLSVADLIRSSGYPAEEHEVTTTDGYRLRMDRIPRSGKQVVFFVHGILDTSLSWVCTGATESQAFAAWDAGCDVWLANSRSNPPRQHVDPAFQGPAYWHYSVNELGLHDLHAQIEHLHNVKCRELGAGIVTIPRSTLLHTGARRSSEEGSATQQAKNGSSAGTGGTTVLSRKLLVPPPSDPGARKPVSAAVNQPQQAGGSALLVDTSAGAAVGLAAPAAVAMTSTLFKAASGELRCGGRRLHGSSRTGWPGAPPEGPAGGRPQSRQSRHSVATHHAGGVRHSCDARLPCCAATQAHTSAPPSLLPSSAAAAGGGVACTPLMSPETEMEGACRAFEEAECAGAHTGSMLFPNLPTAFSMESPVSTFQSAAQDTASVRSLPGTWASPEVPSSVFSWLPASVAVAEQEALQLGVQRTGPYFLSSTVPAIDDVVQINMQVRSLAAHAAPQSAPASRITLPVTDRQQLAPQPTPKACLPVVPASPGTPPLPCSTAKSGTVPNGRDCGHELADAAAAASAGPGEAAAVNSQLRASDEAATEGSKPRSAAAAAGHAAAPGVPLQPASFSAPQEPQEPYALTGVGHSLGGAALLMYIVQFRRSSRRHRLSRLVLLTPAGFIERLPAILRPIAFVLPTVLQITTRLFPRVLSLPVFIPTALLRSLMFRLTADMKHLPALTNLIRSCTSFFMNGDSSGWDQAVRMAHYNKNSMPAVSLLQAKHMLQWLNTGRFSMFDYGSRDLNVAAYGQPQPVDIAAEYWRINVPVDFAAGRHDGIITPACVKKHWQHMMASSVPNVSYREFDFGHLDFTFSAKQDLRHHVISCIEQGA